MINVGKYSSPMDPMGMYIYIYIRYTSTSWDLQKLTSFPKKLQDLFYNQTEWPEFYTTPVLPHHLSSELKDALYRSWWPTRRPQEPGKCNETVPMRYWKKQNGHCFKPKIRPFHNAKWLKWFTAKCNSWPWAVFWKGAPSIPALKIKASNLLPEALILLIQAPTERKSESSHGGVVSILPSGTKSVMSFRVFLFDVTCQKTLTLP